MKITQNTRILVVEDFEVMRRVTCSQLRGLGAAQIQTAKDGAEALQILQRQAFDLILSDWNMPVMTGLELLIAVRSDKTLRHIPFMMITAEAERERVIEAIAHGVSELLVKPYTASGLAERINKTMSWRPPRNLGSSKALTAKKVLPKTLYQHPVFPSLKTRPIAQTLTAYSRKNQPPIYPIAPPFWW